MFSTPVKTVSIAASGQDAPLSKNQKAFNKLIRQIEQKRQQLAAWEAVTPRYQKKYTEEMLPLLKEVDDLQGRLAQQLDNAHGKKGLTRAERRLLSELITSLVSQLANVHEDTGLQQLYNKHSHSDFDEDLAQEQQKAKEMIEQMMGIELDDDVDFNSMDDVVRQAQAKLLEKEAQELASEEARQASRKKTAKQIAREALLETEEKNLSDSIREVYRKLASALHPDREPDPAERERKNTLMQKVNQAYDSRNLLQLLEYQLELEHIDPAALAQLSEDRLKRYNAILKEQAQEIDAELLHVEHQFCARFEIPPFQKIRPETVLRQLDIELIEKRHAMREMARDIVAFDDIKAVKAFLRSLREADADHFDDMPF